MGISKTEYQKYLSEILTFADDTNDVINDPQGNIIFSRLNQMMSIKLKKENHDICVEYNNVLFPYRTFMAKYLANMDIMARHIIDKDQELDDMYYVDGQASLTTDEERIEDTALKLLDKECNREVFIGSKICFVTANAGHGKTLLLRQYQRDQAKKYIKGNTDYLFLHIDLHGHDLRKLDAVIMYELAGVLRMPGLYTNSIITLMRNGLLILGVDGFDELAVETGGEKAIGSFNNLVRDLDSQGVLVAASRRTFFNTQDYIKKRGYLDDVGDAYFCFDELKLQNWNKAECSEYMQWAYDGMTSHDAEREYENVLAYLSPNEHNPLVERPFLFTNIVECSIKEGVKVSEYLREGGSTDVGLERIINTFLRREVKKWNSNNLKDKREYLTFEQHEELLSSVAEDMWLSQREYISLDVLEFNLSVLLEEWGVLPNLHPDILKMSKSHALLVADSHGDNFRRFDHEEFKNYFLAKSIMEKILKSINTGQYALLKRVLAVGQLPDAVALYISQMKTDYDKILFVQKMLEEVRKDYRTTFFQTNFGTLIPFILDKVCISKRLEVGPKLVFSSLVFENKTLRNIIFDSCYFVNVSFTHTKLIDVHFKNCEFTDIRLHEKNDCQFDNVTYDNGTKIHRVSEYTLDNELLSSEFSPDYVDFTLFVRGFKKEKFLQDRVVQPCQNNTEYRKAVRRFLNKYMTSSTQYEKNIKEDPIYNSRSYDLYVEDIIPLLEKYQIIREVKNNNSRQLSTRAWALDKYDLREVYEAESLSYSPLFNFWKEVNEHK